MIMNDTPNEWDSNLKRLGRYNLPNENFSNKTQEQIIDILIAQGQKMIEKEAEEKKDNPPPVTSDPVPNVDKTKLEADLKSPLLFKRAKATWILNPRNKDKAEHLLKVELHQIPSDRFYDDYIHEIAELADNLPPLTDDKK